MNFLDKSSLIKLYDLCIANGQRKFMWVRTMITGAKIDYVEVKREKDATPTGLNINVNIDEAKVEKGALHLKYTYIVNYEEGVATLKISGTLVSDESKPEKIVEEFKKTKKLPDEFAEEVLNAINFTCSTNGTLVVRALNLMPPMVLPRIQVAKGGAAASGKKAA